MPTVTFTVIDRDFTSCDTPLVLGAGGGFEYAIDEHMSAGTHVRYQHLFTSGDALDAARVEGHARWKWERRSIRR